MINTRCIADRIENTNKCVTREIEAMGIPSFLSLRSHFGTPVLLHFFRICMSVWRGGGRVERMIESTTSVSKNKDIPQHTFFSFCLSPLQLTT